MLLNKTKLAKINNATSDKAIEIFLSAIVENNEDINLGLLEILTKATVDRFFKEINNALL